MRIVTSDHIAYLRSGLEAVRLPCDEQSLERLSVDYLRYRSEADELLAVPLGLVAEPEPPGPSGSGPFEPHRPPSTEPGEPEPTGGAGSIAATAAAIRTGELRSTDLIEELLARADRLDAELGSYLSRFDDTARTAASRADSHSPGGQEVGPLHGVPIAIKDNLTTADGPTTAQSAAMPAVPAVDAEAVRRLRAAGAVIIGKTSLMEFATGLPDPDQRFPTPRNPWDLSRWSGGSSSGSANGVAAGLFPGALGTDTGGSIRNPAAFCGASGLKPTYELVPRGGMVPLAPSLDCVGPIARSAEDCALLMSVLAPGLPRDPRWTGSLAGLRIGVDRAGTVEVAGAEAGVVRAFDEALDVLRAAGARVSEVTVPHPHVLRFIMRLLIDCERLAAHLPNLHARWDDYSPTFQAKVRRGVFGSGAEVSMAHQVRADARSRVDRLWADVDVIASPTSLYTAPPVEGLQAANRPELQMTAMWSVLGHPAASVPMGVAANGLPVGLQLAGPWYADRTVLAVAAAYQRLTGWHERRPPLGSRSGA